MHMMKQRRRHAPGDSERVDFALMVGIHGHVRKSGLCELVDPRALALTSTPCFWLRRQERAKKETLFSENRDPSELRNSVLDGCDTVPYKPRDLGIPKCYTFSDCHPHYSNYGASFGS